MKIVFCVKMTKHLKVLPVPTDKCRTANRLTSSGQSALVTAVEHGYDECLEPLVIAGADVNETDELNVSVLMKPCYTIKFNA